MGKIDIENHAELFMQVLYTETFLPLYAMFNRGTHATCRTRLVEAVKTVERIDEVTCGLWEVKIEGQRRWSRKEWNVLVVAQATPEFLRRLKVQVRHRVKKDSPVTPVLFHLGCSDCAEEFVRYCGRRFKPETYMLSPKQGR